MPTTTFNQGNAISGLNNQITNRPDEIPYYLMNFTETVTLEENTVKVGTRDVSGDGVWGKGFNDSGNTVDNLNWGDTTAIWDNTYANEVVYNQILNPSGKFREHFVDTEYVDTTSSTGAISLGASGTIVLESGETLQSTLIHSDGKNITKAKLYVNTALITNDDNLTYELSNDNGSTWETVVLNEVHTFSSTGSQLLYKFTNNSSGTSVYGTAVYGTDTYGAGSVDITFDTSYVNNQKYLTIDITTV